MKVIARTTYHLSPEFNPATATKDDLQFRTAACELLESINRQGGYGCIVSVDDFDGQKSFSRHLYPAKDLNYELRGPITVDVLFDKAHLRPTTLPALTDPVVAAICDDKLATYEIFFAHQPLTLPIPAAEDFQSVLSQFLTQAAHPDPIAVLKPLNEGGGRGIHIAPLSELRRIAIPANNFPYLIQEFIESSAGLPGLAPGRHDLRILLLNGEILGGSIRQPAAGKFLSNTHQGGSMTMLSAAQLPESATTLAREVDAKLPQRPRLISVDMLYSAPQHRFFLMELNTSPGLLPSSFAPVGPILQEKLPTVLLGM